MPSCRTRQLEQAEVTRSARFMDSENQPDRRIPARPTVETKPAISDARKGGPIGRRPRRSATNMADRAGNKDLIGVVSEGTQNS